MTEVFQFKLENPPTINGRGHKTDISPVLQFIRQHPGQWALVGEFDCRSTATARRKLLVGQGAKATVRACPATAATPKIHKLYARMPNPKNDLFNLLRE